MTTSTWTQEQLVAHVQDAVQLELFTIPLYLCAYYSVAASSDPAAALLQDTVNEEMLHLELACNVLNALGGKPVLTGTAAPSYPSDIPFIYPALSLDLGPASLRQILMFMQIELPGYDDPTPEAGPQPDYPTIGAFYDAVEAGLAEVDQFPGPPANQASGVFDDGSDFAVTNLATANQALTLIVEQGEGTSSSPDDPEGALAHYFRFLEIAEHPGWLLPANGAPSVRNMIYGPGALTYSQPQGALLAFFDGCYSFLLERLEADFNGSPGDLKDCVNEMMFGVVDPTVQYVVSQVYDQPSLPESGQNLTPCFRYVDAQYPSTSVLQTLYDAMCATDQAALAGVASTLQLTPATGP